MHDVQRLRRAVEHVHERAAVVELFDGAVHALEPVARLLRASAWPPSNASYEQGRSRDGMGRPASIYSNPSSDDGFRHGRLGDDGLHRCTDDVRVHRRPRQARGELAVVHEIVREPVGAPVRD